MDSDCCFTSKDFSSWVNENACYGVSSYAENWLNEDGTVTGSRAYNADMELQDYTVDYGDIFSDSSNEIQMELDVTNKTLRYFINGKDQGIAYHTVSFRKD